MEVNRLTTRISFGSRRARLHSCTEATQPRPRQASRVATWTAWARTAAAALALTASPALSTAVARAESGSSPCTRFASPSGSDTAPGSLAAPLRTAQALANAVGPGEVGCLETGTYPGGVTFEHGGAAGAPVVLRSYPGESALVTGRVYVPHRSPYVTVADLHLDGNYQAEGVLPSPTVDASHATFEGDDVTNDHTEICFDLGSETWGVAEDTVIANDHIHDCGVLPAANHDHGIYVQDAVGAQIVGNVIDRNADRGIQLYPNSTDATITDNTISENGEGIIFSGDGGVASSGNRVEHNLIVDSLIRSDVESWYPSGNPKGSGNVVQANCVSSRGIDTSGGGFAQSGNVIAGTSELAPAEPGVYVPVAGTACAAMVSGLPTAAGAPVALGTGISGPGTGAATRNDESGASDGGPHGTRPHRERRRAQASRRARAAVTRRHRRRHAAARHHRRHRGRGHRRHRS